MFSVPTIEHSFLSEKQHNNLMFLFLKKRAANQKYYAIFAPAFGKGRVLSDKVEKQLKTQ